MLAGLFALVSLAGAVSGPSAPQRYRIEVKTQQEVDASAMGQGKINNELSAVGFITVTMSDTTGGRIAHIVVDSITIPADMQLPPQLGDPASAKGVFFHGYLINGKVQGGFKPSQAVPIVTLLAGGIEGLFPGLRATAKVGDSWVDTVTTDRSGEGTMQKTSTLSSWKVSAGEAGALTFEATTTGTIQSEGPSPVGKQTVVGKNTGRRTLVGPLNGPMTKGKITANQDMIVALEGQTDTATVVGVTEITFSIIP